MKKLDIHQWIYTLPIQGEKVLVRPFQSSDLSKKYISWLNNPDIMRYSNQRFLTHSLDSVEEFFKSFIGSSNIFLAIEDTKKGQHIGTMTIYVQSYHRTADVGILIGKRGKGYGSEAWGLTINWLLNVCQVRKVTAGALACNLSMVCLMEQAGMKHEATRTDQELVNGKPQDVLYFAKFNAT